ncbi:phosphoribosyl-ATP diphosphatase [Listeria seeligeri]|uniref:Phosphoribosyl-ATP pyrophosphatase n=2 Tax=Listeria seeligeri TaxID=1640 RepID=A0A7X1C6I3_LISSE|nr:phosphoribosyl-ATP diphosphatase [Listeria seeligeri]EFS04184.1 phosphoribosyl-ATP diphosphatase [Listeria seeligeri FSL S4-171]EFS01129.1 phosphoribosyl-ATP diphosphatase [Listeria seeligeri FSL N1-067]KKD44916.1 phosphoribosyl-ATP pyrophosphatase [Listeria seeligeri]MBC1486168.1 phosphoribosyl-ATP diphosphatase [Listeria seeligeri]MBC1578196.1 phosphoribosyl-ATP diphosphatase [Listeria seeligeri]
MLDKLYEEISLRKETPKEGSYTNYLFDKGLDKILKKVGEETTEVVIAAKNNDQELISEVSDLTYHLLVLLVEKNIPLSAIQAELDGRAGKLSTTRDRKEIDKL